MHRILSLFLLLPMLSQAHLPALYGWEFLRADQGAIGDSAGCDRLGTPAQEIGADNHLRLIEALELQHGPYGADLAEPLADLGRWQRERGHYEDAVRAYRRALHLVRINHGLRSDQQLAILNDLVESFRALGDFPAVDEVQNQKFTVLGGGREPDAERNVKAGLDYIRWQREAYGLQYDGLERERLLQAYLLNQRLLDALPEDAPAETRRQLIYSQLSNLYLIMGDRYLQPGSEKIGAASELQPSQAGSPSYVQRRLADIQNEGIEIGEKLFRDLPLQAGSGGALATAAIQLELGDWYQWNGDIHHATRTYALVDQTLREAGKLQILRQWLDSPRELPEQRPFQQYGSVTTGTEDEVVTVRFKVTARGQVQDIEFIGDGERFPEQGARVKRMLAETHFRPRMVNGKAQAANDIQREYRLITEPGGIVDECVRG